MKRCVWFACPTKIWCMARLPAMAVMKPRGMGRGQDFAQDGINSLGTGWFAGMVASVLCVGAWERLSVSPHVCACLHVCVRVYAWGRL